MPIIKKKENDKDPKIEAQRKHFLSDHHDEVDIDNRVLTFHQTVEEYVISDLLSQINFLVKLDSNKPITVRVETNGGDPYSALRYVDTLGTFPVKINSVVMGKVESAGTILSIGTTGEKLMGPHAFMMFHELQNWGFGETTKLKSRAEHMDVLQKVIVSIYMQHTGIKTAEEWALIMGKETYYSAEEALKRGIIDRIAVI
jgi:ATP-dependent Clp protease, protease subunit